MANTFTANYTLIKPEVGAATNTWGGLINTNFDTIDTQIKARDTQAADAQATANAALSRAGGTMTGFVTLHANPTSNFHPATKQYVDDFLSRAGGAMSGYITLHAAPVNIMHPANKKYVDDALAQAQIQAGAGLPLTGGTMQGYITLNAAPTSNLHAATKKYVDDGDAALTPSINAKVSKAGDTMTGPLVLSADPTSGSDIRTAVTKNYVDTTLLPRAGGTLTGNLTLFADPSADMHPVTRKFFTDNALTRAGGSLTGYLSLFADPVSSMHAVTRQFLESYAFSRTQTASQSMSGPLVLSADPTGLSSPLQAVTKNYVDTTAVLRSGTGSTPMSGYLSLIGDPTQANHAATKAYVDAASYLDQDLKTISGLTGGGYLRRDAGGSWVLEASAGVQSITASGDVTGTGASTITLTLANSGVTSGTYNNDAASVRPFTVDGKGRITSIGTAVTIAPSWSNITSKPTTLSGYGITDALTVTTANANYVARSSGSFSGTMSGGSISLNTSNGAISGASLSVGGGNINCGSVTSSGEITCSTLTASGDITAFSDIKLKEDIHTIFDATGIVNQLRGVSYARKDTGKLGIGVIAQEVEKVLPQLVATDVNGTKSVAYANMVGVLIQAIKELSARIDELEAR
jgi:hypothetical protein